MSELFPQMEAEGITITEVPVEVRREHDLSDRALLERAAACLRWRVAPIKKADARVYAWLLHDLRQAGIPSGEEPDDE